MQCQNCGNKIDTNALLTGVKENELIRIQCMCDLHYGLNIVTGYELEHGDDNDRYCTIFSFDTTQIDKYNNKDLIRCYLFKKNKTIEIIEGPGPHYPIFKIKYKGQKIKVRVLTDNDIITSKTLQRPIGTGIFSRSTHTGDKVKVHTGRIYIEVLSPFFPEAKIKPYDTGI